MVEKSLAVPSAVTAPYPALFDEARHFFLLFQCQGAKLMGNLPCTFMTKGQSKMEEYLCSQRDL